MTREELIQAVAQAENISEEEVDAVVDQFLDLIRSRMADQNETSIYGFGKFGVRWWKGRSGRDPQTGEEIEIEGRWMPYWTPSDTLVEEGEPHPKDEAAVGEEPEKSAEPQDLEEPGEETSPRETESQEPTETATQSEDTESEPEETSAGASEEEPVQPAEPTPTPQQATTPSYTPHYRTSHKSSSSRKWLITLGAIVAVIVLAFIAFSFMGERSGEMAENSTAEPEIKSETATQNTNSGTPSQSLSSETAPGKGASTNKNAGIANGTALAEASSARSTSRSQEQFFENYQSALDQFRDRNYSAAKDNFQQLLNENPPIDYLDNVQYWLGESEFALGEYDQAITSFGQVFRYPETNKMDDAMLMMAYAYRQLGEYDQARLLLLRFRNQYSDSPYANIAERWLQNDSLQLAKSH